MKSTNIALMALTIGMLSTSTPIFAAVEDLASDNSTFETAQILGNLSEQGVISLSGLRGVLEEQNLFDDDFADYYRFEITEPTILKLSVLTPGGPSFEDDPIVGLFAPNGNLLAFNDDSVEDNADSFLQYRVDEPGFYVAAVTGWDDFNFDGISDEGDLTVTNFAYTLQLESTPVPLPSAAWLMGAMIFGLPLIGKSSDLATKAV